MIRLVSGLANSRLNDERGKGNAELVAVSGLPTPHSHGNISGVRVVRSSALPLTNCSCKLTVRAVPHGSCRMRAVMSSRLQSTPQEAGRVQMQRPAALQAPRVRQQTCASLRRWSTVYYGVRSLDDVVPVAHDADNDGDAADCAWYQLTDSRISPVITIDAKADPGRVLQQLVYGPYGEMTASGAADFNGDGFQDYSDFNDFIAAFEATNPAAAGGEGPWTELKGAQSTIWNASNRREGVLPPSGGVANRTRSPRSTKSAEIGFHCPQCRDWCNMVRFRTLCCWFGYERSTPGTCDKSPCHLRLQQTPTPRRPSWRFGERQRVCVDSPNSVLRSGSFRPPNGVCYRPFISML